MAEPEPWYTDLRRHLKGSRSLCGKCAFHIEQWDNELRSRLLSRRFALNISQRKLAEMIGIHQSTLSHLENSRAGLMRLDLLSTWADALDLRIDITLQDGGITLRFINLPPTR